MHLLEIKSSRLERPFSTAFGSLFKVPGSPCNLIIYPGYIEVAGYGSIELPVKKARSFSVYVDFTSLQLVVEVITESCFSRFYVKHEDLFLTVTGKGFLKQLLVSGSPYPKRSQAKLHFGIHKEPELSAMAKRGDLLEWLPIWHAFGNFVMDGKRGKGGNWDLLEKKELDPLLRSSRQGLWVPSQEDFYHLGWSLPLTEKGDADLLLQQPSIIIEENILHLKEGHLLFLPFDQITIHSGRAQSLSIDGVVVDLHWRSNSLIKVKMRLKKECKWRLCFPKPIKKARCWQNGRAHSIENGEELTLTESSIYYFDQFTH